MTVVSCVWYLVLVVGGLWQFGWVMVGWGSVVVVRGCLVCSTVVLVVGWGGRLVVASGGS